MLNLDGCYKPRSRTFDLGGGQRIPLSWVRGFSQDEDGDDWFVRFGPAETSCDVLRLDDARGRALLAAWHAYHNHGPNFLRRLGRLLRRSA